ncbi:MAG: hypothetical protein ABIP53_02465 [Candidatus Limnocylindrales bacterium]
MQTLDTSLLARVNEVIDAHTNCELLSTSGLQATVDELVRRNRGLELALQEVAAEVQKLAEVRGPA